MDLARAKTEALDNIYSLLKQNIKSCNAKRRRQRRRSVKNKNRSNQQKKQLCTCSTLFLYISLPLFCKTTTWNFQKLLRGCLHWVSEGRKILEGGITLRWVYVENTDTETISALRLLLFFSLPIGDFKKSIIEMIFFSSSRLLKNMPSRPYQSC